MLQGGSVLKACSVPQSCLLACSLAGPVISFETTGMSGNPPDPAVRPLLEHQILRRKRETPYKHLTTLRQPEL